MYDVAILVAAVCFLSQIFVFFPYFVLALLRNRMEIRGAGAAPLSEGPSVAVLIPFYNSGPALERTIRSLLKQSYPIEEIILVDDGSTDNASHEIWSKLSISPSKSDPPEGAPFESVVRCESGQIGCTRIVLFQKAKNEGKQKGMELGFSWSRSPYVCLVDADIVLEPGAVGLMMKGFVSSEPPRVVTGTFRIHPKGDVPRKWLPRAFMLELLNYYVFKVLHNSLNSQNNISGGLSIYDRCWILEVGLTGRTIVENLDLALDVQTRAHQQGTSPVIRFAPDAVGWMDAVQTYGQFRGQRHRWAGGTLETYLKYTDLIGLRHGWLGMWVIPSRWIEIAMTPVRVLSPICLVFALATAPFSRGAQAVLSLALAYWFVRHVLFTAYSLRLNDVFTEGLDRLARVKLVFFQAMFGPIYYTIITWFAFEGYLRSLLGKLEWGLGVPASSNQGSVATISRQK